MSLKHIKTTGLAAIVALGLSTTGASASYCSDGNTVKFAGISWESGAFITEVIMNILETGYDCQVDSIPGNSITLEQAVANNDIQIFAEEWLGRSDIWNKAVDQGKVVAIGKTFVGASEGWFVPDYVIKGDEKRGIEPMAPDLKSVTQLSDPKYVELFTDPEEPSKGRFLNCPSGWTCEGISTAKLEAYQLDDHYVNFRPGTGTALDAAIKSAYLQGEPLLFYYWSPTAMMGKFNLIQLDEPAYSDACWAELSKSDGKREEACAFPSVDVAYGVNSTFAKEAPEIAAVLEKATFPLEDVNGSLAYMADNEVDADVAAKEFLKTKADVWGEWVSPEAKAKIEDSLK
ncbi:ABC transporter substrate-binding protein [Thalassospira australica]|uniref:ABC transporter substrate-binding protein n=1 Tax=Thalassospira australica TaxID=1528106 RepID=UPI00384F19CF